MASTVPTNVMRTELKVDQVVTGNISSATDVKWVDMKRYDHLLVSAVATALTGVGLTTFKILANSQSNGGGTDVLVRAHAIGSAPDAVSDTLVLEISASELAPLGTDLRYVSVNAVAANAADTHVFTYVRRARVKQADLTLDVVA